MRLLLLATIAVGSLTLGAAVPALAPAAIGLRRVW
jgi:hypothetical protein